MAMPGGRPAQLAAVDSRLAGLPWLSDIAGATFYAVGGVWRAFAKVHMEQTGHKLHIIHHYAIDAAEAIDFAQLLSRQSKASLEGSSVSRRRIEALPYAAMFMERLLKRAAPRRLVFSAFGLREGIVHDLLPPDIRAEDPLLAACRAVADRVGRFGDAAPLIAWVSPLCPAEEPISRLTMAACLLSDIGWLEHPDYRGEQAYLRALRMPVGGIDHVGRAFIAFALHLRYGGRIDDPIAGIAQGLLDDTIRGHCIALGLALRLAYAICGGALALLNHTSLHAETGRLILEIAPQCADLRVEAVDKRLEALAKALKLAPELRIGAGGP
jgi:exopolyphosphatase/guanosine-5'-triphosphate,3'-diphosphate pyrophosphatase